MKPLLYIVGLTWMALACHNDISPNDLLYRRWELVQNRQGSGGWVQNKSTALYDTEYRPDGTLTYRLDGKVTEGCCYSSQFNRQGNELTFSHITGCALVLCSGPSTDKTTITQLTNDLLELTRGQTVSQYKPV